MVLDKILNVLHDELKNEIEGASKYMELASMAEMAGLPRMHKYLMDIARDEFTHADFIFTTLKKSGMDISHECYKKLEELRVMVNK